LADTFVKDAAAVGKVHPPGMVTVLEDDLPRKRLALSLKSNPGQSERRGLPADGGDRKRPAGQGGPKRPGGNQQQRGGGRPEAQPFNNPFAALKKK
jgi:uncharacterized protein